jgi:hypothetical protein
MTSPGAPPDEALRDILQAGIRAPTADNRPVVRLRLAEDHVALWAEPEVAAPLQPHRRALGLLATGAMVENMALRSRRHGLALQAAWLPAATEPALLATLRWAPASAPLAAADAMLDGAIEGRHTNRRFYRREPVPPPAVAAVNAAVAAVPGTSLQWLQGAARRRGLQAVRLAEAERFRRAGLHGEMFDSIRFDLGWRATSDEGLPPATLEVEPPLRGGFALLRHWPLMHAVRWLGVPWMLGVRAGWLPCVTASHLGLLSVRRDHGEAGWLEAGRAFERLWLAAQSQGLALQPMAAAVALTLQRPGGDWVSPSLQARLAGLLGGLVDPAQQACMLLRVGVANKPNVVTARRLLSRYIDPSGLPLQNGEKLQSNQRPARVDL